MANISKINFKGVEYDIKPLMDSTPTQGSTNAVQSGGVKSALDTLQAQIPQIDAVPTQGSTNAVSSGGVYEVLDTLGEELNSTTENFNNFVETGESVVYKGTVSGTRAVTADVNIPVGTYNLHIDNISSSDTDSDKSMIQYRYDGGGLDRLDKVYERGVEIDSIVTFVSPVVRIAFFAAQNLANSNGDSFEYSGVKLYTEPFAKKTDFDDAKGDLIAMQTESIDTRGAIAVSWSAPAPGYLNNNGVWSTNNTVKYTCTDLIPCVEGDEFVYHGEIKNYTTMPSVLFYDEDKTTLLSFESGIRGIDITKKVTIPSGVHFVKFQVVSQNADIVDGKIDAYAYFVKPTSIEQVSKSAEGTSVAVSDMQNYIGIDTNTNLIDLSTAEDGMLDATTGNVIVPTSVNHNVWGYATSDFIEVDVDSAYFTNPTTSIANAVVGYNSEKEFIANSITRREGAVVITGSAVKYVRVGFTQANKNNVFFKKYGAKVALEKAGLYSSVNIQSELFDFNWGDYAENSLEKFKKTNNLFDVYTSNWMYMVGYNNGILNPISNYSNGAIALADYIAVQEGEAYYSNFASWAVCAYDENKNYLSTLTQKRVGNYRPLCWCVTIPSDVAYIRADFKFSNNGAQGYDTDPENSKGFIRSEKEIFKLFFGKADKETFYPVDTVPHMGSATYKLLGKFVEPDFDVVPDKDSELFRMIRCEAIRAVNHTKHIYRIGSFNQYVIRKQNNWYMIKKMLADYGVDICGFQEAQYQASQVADEKKSLGDFLKGWQFSHSAEFYPQGTTASPYSNRDMVSLFPVVESEELPFPDVGQGSYNNRSVLRTKIKLPRYLDCTGGDQYLGFYVIHPTVTGTVAMHQAEFGVCLDAMQTDGCAFHIIAADSNAFYVNPETGMPAIWDWMREQGFKLANDGLSKTVTNDSPDHGGSIDQLFVSNNINVINFNVINSWDYAYPEANGVVYPLSDHDFIYADIEFDYSNIVTRIRPMTEVAFIQNLTNVNSDANDDYHVPITQESTTVTSTYTGTLDNAVVANLTAESRFTLSSVVVKIGGTDKTSEYYNNGVINIPAGTSVKGDIVVTATAT